jgi:hypothetical protein
MARKGFRETGRQLVKTDRILALGRATGEGRRLKLSAGARAELMADPRCGRVADERAVRTGGSPA